MLHVSTIIPNYYVVNNDADITIIVVLVVCHQHQKRDYDFQLLRLNN